MEAWSRIRLGMLAVVLAASCGTRALTKDGGSVDGDAGGATGRYRQAPAAPARPRVAASGSPVSRAVGKAAGAASPVRPAAARMGLGGFVGTGGVSGSGGVNGRGGFPGRGGATGTGGSRHRDGRCRGRRRNRGPGRIQRHRGKRARRRVGRGRSGRNVRRRRHLGFGRAAASAGRSEPVAAASAGPSAPAVPAAAAAAERGGSGGGIGGTAGIGGTGGTSGRGGMSGTGGGVCLTCRTTVLPIAARDLVYNAARNELYASVAGDAAAYPNTIVVIDPSTSSVVSTIPIGSNPRTLALSDDGSTLWVGIDGAHAFRKVTMGSTPPVVGPLIHLPKAMPTTLLRRGTRWPCCPARRSSVAVVLYDGVLRARSACSTTACRAAAAATNGLIAYFAGRGAAGPRVRRRQLRLLLRASRSRVGDHADDAVLQSASRLREQPRLRGRPGVSRRRRRD